MKIPSTTALLGAGLLALAAVSPAAAADAPPGAYGEAKAVPDRATLSLNVTAEAASAAEALGQNRAQTAAVLDALRKAGVPDKDIRTAGLSLQPQYTYRQNEAPLLRGYEAANELTVTVDDLGRLGRVIDTAVTAGGARINAVSLGLRDRQSAEDGARLAAVKALEAKAKLYAQATGRRIERLESLSEGGFAPAPGPVIAERFAGAMKAGGEIVAPGELTVHVEVAGVYELE
jgi:uncharacterized protein YggE